MSKRTNENIGIGRQHLRAAKACQLHGQEDGVKNVFANELSPKQQALVYATQTPASHTVFDDKSGEPAWKQKPTWYAVAKNDKTIHPDLERFMAKRMNAKTTELASCHVMMLSHPAEVLRVIEEAANSKDLKR